MVKKKKKKAKINKIRVSRKKASPKMQLFTRNLNPVTNSTFPQTRDSNAVLNAKLEVVCRPLTAVTSNSSFQVVRIRIKLHRTQQAPKTTTNMGRKTLTRLLKTTMASKRSMTKRS